LETEVGRTILLTGFMEAGVLARALNTEGGDVLAISSIVADQTAHLYLRQSPGIELISESGHVYSAVPEPCLTSLFVGGCTGFSLRRVRRKWIPTA
jgi:hypothetical protein